MSRIGNNPVAIPEGVTVEINDNAITVKGKLGELTQAYDTVEIREEDGHVVVSRNEETKEHKAKQKVISNSEFVAGSDKYVWKYHDCFLSEE